MIQCLDIHTHHNAPQPYGVIAVTPETFNPEPGQFYSMGIHPWVTTGNIYNIDWENFKNLASHPQVVAIGECGIDKLKGGFLFKQLIVMNKQINISEELKKPLIIHDVKAHDVIVGLKRDLEPKQKWLVHGLRGKPTVAKMLTDAGIYVSFGENFNSDSPAIVPQNMILAETDESLLSIQEIISKISENLHYDVTDLITQNTRDFLFNENSKNETK